MLKDYMEELFELILDGEEDGVFANSDDEDNTDRAPEQSIYAANALNSGWNNDDENSGQRMSGTGEQPEQDTEDDTDRLIDLIRKLSRG